MTEINNANEPQRFKAAVDKGIAEAERGELIEEEEMDARVQRMLSSNLPPHEHS